MPLQYHRSSSNDWIIYTIVNSHLSHTYLLFSILTSRMGQFTVSLGAHKFEPEAPSMHTCCSRKGLPSSIDKTPHVIIITLTLTWTISVRNKIDTKHNRSTARWSDLWRRGTWCWATRTIGSKVDKMKDTCYFQAITVDRIAGFANSKDKTPTRNTRQGQYGEVGVSRLCSWICCGLLDESKVQKTARKQSSFNVTFCAKDWWLEGI